MTTNPPERTRMRPRQLSNRDCILKSFKININKDHLYFTQSKAALQQPGTHFDLRTVPPLGLDKYLLKVAIGPEVIELGFGFGGVFRVRVWI